MKKSRKTRMSQMHGASIALSVAAMATLAGCAQTAATSSTSSSRAESANAAPARFTSPVMTAMLRTKAIDELTESAFDSEPLLRANAIEGLQEAPEVVEPIARAGLHDSNLGVRFVAAMVIGKLKLRDSVVFVEPLLNDSSTVVRAAAIFALRENGQNANPTLLATMLESRDTTERAQAALILGLLGDPSAIGMLRSAARRSSPLTSMIEDRIARLQIAEALVKLGDVEAIETIRAALYPSRPEDLEATALAVQIIGNVNDRRSIDQLVYLTAREGQDKLPAEVRLGAAMSLAKLGNRRGGFIAEEYWQDANPAIRAQAAFVFGATTSPDNLEKLDLLMDDEIGFVRIAAASATLDALDRLPQTASVDTQR